MSATLVLHCGAREVSKEELALVPCPEPSGIWRPVPHSTVLQYATDALTGAGYEVEKMQLGLTRDSQRFFGALTLRAPLVPGVSLAVGIRSSTDKSLALGACFGSRTFVCDNLAFTSQKVISRKHTTHAVDRYREAVCRVMTELDDYRKIEGARLERLQNTPLTDEAAESYLLRAYEQQILSPRTIATAIREWRTPSFPEFAEARNAFRLYQALTYAVGARVQTNPQAHADCTIRISRLVSPDVPAAPTP